MELHGNARTTLFSRLLIVRRVEDEGWTLVEAAIASDRELACLDRRQGDRARQSDAVWIG